MNQGNIRVDLRLENFKVTDANQAAFNKATQLVEARVAGQGAGECVYFYGEKGSGKTHLLSAIVNGASKADGCKVVYVTPETIGEAAEAELSAADVLIVDGFERVGVRYVQTLLENVFDGSIAAGHTIICAGDREPAKYPLNEACIGKLSSGAIIKM